MKIYTRTGDAGQTALFSGERVDKDDLRIEAYGTVDELNSALGMAKAFCEEATTKELILSLQNQLFVAGADLATRTGGRRQVGRIEQTDWEDLERWIDRLASDLPVLKNFILPGGTTAAAILQFARSVCRRAERLSFRLKKHEPDVNSDLLIFLNRLSDLLFIMARWENSKGGGEENSWKAKKG